MSKKTSYLGIVAKQYWRFWLNRLGLLIMLFLILVAFFAPVIANDSPYYLKMEGKTYYPVLSEIFPTKHFIKYPQFQDVNFKEIKLEKGDKIIFPPIPYSPTEYNLDIPLASPNQDHLLGTDDQGRDILTRLIYGSRVSLLVGVVAVSIYVILGVIIGSFAGYYGGKIDIVISRIIEMVICFPTFFLVLIVIAFIGPNIFNIVIVIALTSWTGIARLVRSEFLKLRGQDFVKSVEATGARASRIIFRHILPNSLAPVMVSATFGVASTILMESALSFLGFGVAPPTPSWGDILSQARDYMDIAWWIALFPGIAIFVTITALNLIGEGLRDAIDPKMRT